jgi:hypothetical protein
MASFCAECRIQQDFRTEPTRARIQKGLSLATSHQGPSNSGDSARNVDGQELGERSGLYHPANPHLLVILNRGSSTASK